MNELDHALAAKAHAEAVLTLVSALIDADTLSKKVQKAIQKRLLNLLKTRP